MKPVAGTVVEQPSLYSSTVLIFAVRVHIAVKNRLQINGYNYKNLRYIIDR